MVGYCWAISVQPLGPASRPGPILLQPGVPRTYVRANYLNSAKTMFPLPVGWVPVFPCPRGCNRSRTSHPPAGPHPPMGDKTCFFCLLPSRHVTDARTLCRSVSCLFVFAVSVGWPTPSPPTHPPAHPRNSLSFPNLSKRACGVSPGHTTHPPTPTNPQDPSTAQDTTEKRRYATSGQNTSLGGLRKDR